MTYTCRATVPPTSVGIADRRGRAQPPAAAAPARPASTRLRVNMSSLWTTDAEDWCRLWKYIIPEPSRNPAEGCGRGRCPPASPPTVPPDQRRYLRLDHRPQLPSLRESRVGQLRGQFRQPHLSRQPAGIAAGPRVGGAPRPPPAPRPPAPPAPPAPRAPHAPNAPNAPRAPHAPAPPDGDGAGRGGPAPAGGRPCGGPAGEPGCIRRAEAGSGSQRHDAPPAGGGRRCKCDRPPAVLGAIPAGRGTPATRLWTPVRRRNVHVNGRRNGGFGSMETSGGCPGRDRIGPQRHQMSRMSRRKELGHARAGHGRRHPRHPGERRAPCAATACLGRLSPHRAPSEHRWRLPVSA